MNKQIQLSLSFVLLMIAVMQTAMAQDRIVFVCEHGSAKSVIAAAYFNKLAKESGVSCVAVARGTKPDKEISRKTRELLESDGLFDGRVVPQGLSQNDVNDARQLIMFTSFPAELKEGNTVYWMDVKSPNDDFHILRDQIVRRIIPLIDSLKRQ